MFQTHYNQTTSRQAHANPTLAKGDIMYQYDSYIPRSYKRFILRISEELGSGNNVIVRIPEPNLNKEFIKSLQRIIRDYAGPELELLDGSKKTDYKSLISFLNDELANRTERKKNIQAYFKSEYNVFSAFTIYGLDSWSEASQKHVVGELNNIVAFTREQNKSRGQVEGKRFLAFVSPLFPLPPDQDGLTILNWWGITSPADHEFLFEEYVNERTLDSPEMYFWLKALSLSVGGDDPQLIKTIVENEPVTLEDVKEILKNHPLSKLKTPSSSFERHLLIRNLFFEPGKPPENPQEQKLWSLGLLAPNRYSLYHPVMLAKDSVILEKTIAMGQREVFFPLIDQVHAFITFVVEDKIGSLEHIFQNDPDKITKYEKVQTEISFLHYTLQHLIKNTQLEFPETQTLCSLSKLWTNIRHQNAHIQMLPHEYFKKAMSHYKSLYLMMMMKGNR
jgi:hypothetical protein